MVVKWAPVNWVPVKWVLVNGVVVDGEVRARSQAPAPAAAGKWTWSLGCGADWLRAGVAGEVRRLRLRRCYLYGLGDLGSRQYV